MRTLPLERRVTVGRRQLEGQNKLWPVVMMFVSWFLLIVWPSDLIHTGIGVLGNHGTNCSGPSSTQQHSYEKGAGVSRAHPNLTLDAVRHALESPPVLFCVRRPTGVESRFSMTP